MSESNGSAKSKNRFPAILMLSGSVLLLLGFIEEVSCRELIDVAGKFKDNIPDVIFKPISYMDNLSLPVKTAIGSGVIAIGAVWNGVRSSNRRPS